MNIGKIKLNLDVAGIYKILILSRIDKSNIPSLFDRFNSQQIVNVREYNENNKKT